MNRRRFHVPRTCTEIRENSGHEPQRLPPKPLALLRDVPAYVLLGDAGAGKTAAFEHEAEETRVPCRGTYVTARDFITFDDRPEWRDAVLFIDGLDEVRAGTSDGRTILDAIRRKLDRLERPAFRLSCREADWLGASDRGALERVSPEGSIKRLHLDPLGQDEIRAIVERAPEIEDAQGFLDGAEQRGLSDLLTNPQTLRMLMVAVADAGDWPTTRRETYDRACRGLLEERNPEHSAARRDAIPCEQLMHAAGRLCAIQLIAGLAGFAQTEDASDRFHPFVGSLDLQLPHERVRAVLGSNVFRASPAEGQREPLHRSVAEYLAAYHLASRIDDDAIPLGRVLALTTGNDGGVVTALRGLLGWLAALSHRARRALIDRDPIGIILYGDTAEFSPEEKNAVLTALRGEGERYPWFFGGTWDTSPFAALSTPNMEERFRAILGEPSREDADQSLVACTLEVLLHGQPLPQLTVNLLNVTRDPTRWGRIRKVALRATLRTARRVQAASRPLLELLDDIHNGRVEDRDDELLGILLQDLYPETLPPERVLDLLHVPKDEHLLGSYVWFWEHGLLERSSPEQVAVLLDGLATAEELQAILTHGHRFLRFPGRLLSAGLDAVGDDISDERLHAWLGVGLDRHGFACLDQESAERIRAWLAERPERYKGLLAVGLLPRPDRRQAWMRLHDTQARLYHAAPPADLGHWYLHLAELAGEDDVAKNLVSQVASIAVWARGDGGLSLDELLAWAQQHPRFKGVVTECLVCPIDKHHRQHAQFRAQRDEEQRRQRGKWVEVVARQQTAIRRGVASPGLLCDLAKAYYGYFIEAQGDSPAERLSSFLGSREDLVQVVLEGLRNSLGREDLPSAEDVLSLRRKGQEYFLGLPYLAGVDELTRDDPERVLDLRSCQISRALAIHFVRGVGEDPLWLAPLLDARPEQVAKVLVATAAAALRTGTEHVPGLYSLAYDDAYANVARLAALPLLAAFPLRASRRQLENLVYLLKAALRHLGADQLLPMIARKLSLSSLTVTQRGYWLAAGLIADPNLYEKRVATYARGNPARIQALAGFLSSRHDQWAPDTELPASAVGLLIELLGSHYAPYPLAGAGWVTPSMEAADQVRSLIEQLGNDPGEAATRELQRLRSMSVLEAWHKALRSAEYRQATVRREAEFAHPDARQVNRALMGRNPANAADLAALTLEIIDQLAREIRSASTDDFKQYWNVDRYNRPKTPKPEDACRDALLSDLKARLAPLRVDAQPEGRYAEDKRADIRVSFGGTAGFNVPVEIKHDRSPDLWKAIRKQLIGQYTRDPGALGYGIYLVFWFGCHPPPPPNGIARPRTAAELETALCALLMAEEHRLISVRVIDCSAVGSGEPADWSPLLS